MITKIMFSLLQKSLIYKNGSLFTLSFFGAISFDFIIKEMVKGIELKRLYLSIAIAAVGFLIYLLFSIIDFITGMQAAKHETQISGKVFVPRSKMMYRTLWKITGLALLIVLLTMLLLVVQIGQMDWLYKPVILSLLILIFLGCGFEFHSIGENIERRSGRRPEIFKFWERLLNTIEKRIMKNINDTVCPTEEDETKDKNNKDEPTEQN